LKVKELIECLQGLDPELEVYVARDAEGNGFNFCNGAWEYFTTSTRPGAYFIDDVLAEEDVAEYEADDIRKVVVIWP
jgi:hypothetical protein